MPNQARRYTVARLLAGRLPAGGGGLITGFGSVASMAALALLATLCLMLAARLWHGTD